MYRMICFVIYGKKDEALSSREAMEPAVDLKLPLLYRMYDV